MPDQAVVVGRSGAGLDVSSTKLRWTRVNSSAIAGSTTTTATPKTISTLVSVALGAAASAIVSCCGQQVGVLGDAPGPDHGGDRSDRERAGAAAGVAVSSTSTAAPQTSETITSGSASPVRPS